MTNEEARRRAETVCNDMCLLIQHADAYYLGAMHTANGTSVTELMSGSSMMGEGRQMMHADGHGARAAGWSNS